MTGHRWARVKALFQAAVERPPGERRAFLATGAAGDDTVRREVESLLASDGEAARFLDEVPAVAADLVALLEQHDAPARSGMVDEAPDGSAPERIDEAGATFGRYRLLRLLGEGGMGRVWLAQQEHPVRRRVALKVVRAGLDSREILSRFRSERQALAILNHPHIATVLDAGVTDDGRPFFAMEWVDGPRITEFADQRALTLEQRLELFRQVCDAVQHAHQKGLLHRDLKPGNVLVSQQDGRPVAKVIDFGIAKALGTPLTGETLATAFGVLVGTPEYMSPEQAGLVDAAVDTRSDIYSLGLVLYELLVGTPPFDARELRRKPALEALRVIREDEPPPLTARLRALDGAAAEEIARLRRLDARTLRRRLHGDLEWIARRALEKEPAHRYGSVSELRADIDGFLHGEPVVAGPPSTLYRLRKLAHRHRAAAAALAIVAAAVTLSAVVSTLALVRAVRAEDRTRRQLVASLVAQGMQKAEGADSLTGLVYLVRALELETDAGRARSHRLRIGQILKRAPRLVGLWEGGTHMLALSSRGLVATVGADGAIKFRDLHTGAPRGDVRQEGDITGGEFSADGAVLAVASADGRVRLLDPERGRVVREFTLSTSVAGLALSPDGSLVAGIGSDGTIHAWDARHATLRFAQRHEGEGRQAAFSHDGSLLATAARDGVRVWRSATGAPAGPLLRHEGTGGVRHIAFSPDDAWLASAGVDGAARLWDVRSMTPVGSVMRHDAAVTGVTFAGAHLLVTTSVDRTTRTWRVPETSAAGPVRRSAAVVGRPADVSGSLVIASPTLGGAVDLWSIDGDRALCSLPHGGQAITRFDPTGRFLVTAADDGLARIWDLAPSLGVVPPIALDDRDLVRFITTSDDGRSMAAASAGPADGGSVRVFDVATGEPLTPAMRFEAASLPIALSPDGRRLVTASGVGDLHVWDTGSGEPVTDPLHEDIPIAFVGFSPGGDAFVVAGGRVFGSGVGARVRATTDGRPRTGLLPHDGGIYGAWFSCDGRRLLTAGEAGASNIKVWDRVSGRLAWAVGHVGNVHAAAWSADDATVFTGGPDQWIRAWNGSTGTPLPLAIKVLGGISAMAVTQDGTRLLAGTAAGDVRLVDLRQHGSVISAMRHQGYVFQTRFSPDGSLALTAASDRSVRLWDGRTGEPISPNLAGELNASAAAFLGKWGAVAWGGRGVFVDRLTSDEHSVEQLRVLAESHAGRALSASGVEVALSADEIDARLRAANGSVRSAAPSAPVDYERARARLAWRQGAFEDVVAALAPLRARGALQWPDSMRLLGAYAATRLWRQGLDELRAHRSRWQAAPELLYMQAVALAALHDAAGGALHCRAALDATAGTRHPERAYWAARACLVPNTLAPRDRADVEERIRVAYPRMAGTLGQAELRGLAFMRAGRSREDALHLLEAAVSEGTAMRAGAHDYLRPWLDAEAATLRAEVLRARARVPGREKSRDSRPDPRLG